MWKGSRTHYSSQAKLPLYVSIWFIITAEGLGLVSLNNSRESQATQAGNWKNTMSMLDKVSPTHIVGKRHVPQPVRMCNPGSRNPKSAIVPLFLT